MRVVSKTVILFLTPILFNSRQDLINQLKFVYAELLKKNLKVFGITKSKTLIEYQTTENDAKNGNNKIPFNMARIKDEDLIDED